MDRKEIIDWLEWVHETDEDRYLFTMCYFNQNPVAVLHIVDDDYNDDGEILPFILSNVVQAETGYRTLYKMMVSSFANAPSCYNSKPDYIYILEKN